MTERQTAFMFLKEMKKRRKILVFIDHEIQKIEFNSKNCIILI